MTFLDSLGAQALEVVERYLQPKYFPQGTCIIKQGDQGDGCYLIDEGLVRIEFDTGEMDTEPIHVSTEHHHLTIISSIFIVHLLCPVSMGCGN